MGEHWPAPKTTNDACGYVRRKFFACHVRRTASSKPAIKRFLACVRIAGRHECSRNVRPPKSCTWRSGADLLKVNVHLQSGKDFHQSLDATLSFGPPPL
jgi:hypothetical protein